MRYKLPRGTQDVLPAEQPNRRYVTQVAEHLAGLFGYRLITTPIFEQAGLFLRSIGGGTDILEKETYTFEDRGNELLTLRAEGTAPICRAYLEHGMTTWPHPVRLFYSCPIFRYERPQAGRLRQHHQFGVEAIGEADPIIDAEVIELGWLLVSKLGITNINLLLNSIGCAECRPNYLVALKSFYSQHLESVCSDCKSRYERNPLRLLDCKNNSFSCQQLIRTAPKTADYLCAPCDNHQLVLTKQLDVLNIPYKITPTLVRGLDYYSRTVFEIQPANGGGQSTLLAGGRYDGLIEQLGGRPTPAIGFGSGIERLILNLQLQQVKVPDIEPIDVIMISLDPAAQETALKLAATLRSSGFSTVLAPPTKSLRGQMRYAESMNAGRALIIGKSEISKGTVQIKIMNTGLQEEVILADVESKLNAN